MASPNQDVQQTSVDSVHSLNHSQQVQAQQSEIHQQASNREGQGNNSTTDNPNNEQEASGEEPPSSQQASGGEQANPTSNQDNIDPASLPSRARETEEGEAPQNSVEHGNETTQNTLNVTPGNTNSQQTDSTETSSDKEKAMNEKLPKYEDFFTDLLLTACLSVYSENADLTSISKISIFIGYFSLLWWSWWSQTLFDVRYRGKYENDLLMEYYQNFLRGASILGRIGFASVSSEFVHGGYRDFAVFYVLSRVILIFDYLMLIFYIEDGSPGSSDNPQNTTESQEATEYHNTNGDYSITVIKIQCHWIIIVGTIISIVFWSGSVFIDVDKNTVPRKAVVFWCIGISVEIIAQWFIESKSSLEHLSKTPMVKRLRTFSFMVFGNGFDNVGQALKLVGLSFNSRGGSQDGGNAFIAFLNGIASVIIVILLFFDYYPDVDKNKFDADPAQIALWCYTHFILHVTSAVLMIALGQTISYINTLTTLIQLHNHPSSYLPKDSDWQTYINSPNLTQVFNNNSMPAAGDIPSNYTRTVVELIATTISLRGAIVPELDLAQRLFDSTKPFKDFSLPPAASTAYGKYVDAINAMQKADSLDRYLSENFFNFNLVYICPAIYLFGNTVLKELEHRRTDEDAVSRRAKNFSQCIRICCGVILVLVQVILLLTFGRTDPRTMAVESGLIILACILMLESFLQIALKIYFRLLIALRRILLEEI
ncbi:uncharacterized protein FA14DRAFT_183391 [Meira miltonrushii]|uniref:Uncharacterized protein n=1 Tax=Meira miltonrushii TaxID=1280837 RepID=A0A316VJL6_9BASI|nr:uncharacterized protein FA14DRAFT_183391 [Meira miltonrushii]PWN37258.1 hypothetical protein FA14DRAFT_183391 [Meira miltonrushii]